MLQHVALEIRRQDVPAELGFWSLLGFAEVAPPPTLAEDFAWAQRGSAQVHLRFVAAPTVPEHGHLALDLGAEYAAVTEALRAAGHPPEPRAEHWGAPRAFVLTPAGHRVELMARAPGA